GDEEEQLPEVVPVIEPGEAALLRPAAEAVEGAQGHVLLVGGGPRCGAELRARQAYQAAEVPLPEALGGSGVASREGCDPAGDATVGGHEPRPPDVMQVRKRGCDLPERILPGGRSSPSKKLR